MKTPKGDFGGAEMFIYPNGKLIGKATSISASVEIQEMCAHPAVTEFERGIDPELLKPKSIRFKKEDEE